MLIPGDVVALSGELGSGKTVFTKGIARGLGLENVAEVTSPTFVLMQPYDCGRAMLIHVDLYRMDDPEELVELTGDWMFGSTRVTVVEWAERAPELFQMPHLAVDLDIVDPNRRAMRVAGRMGFPPSRFDALRTEMGAAAG